MTHKANVRVNRFACVCVGPASLVITTSLFREHPTVVAPPQHPGKMRKSSSRPARKEKMTTKDFMKMGISPQHLQVRHAKLPPEPP